MSFRIKVNSIEVETDTLDDLLELIKLLPIRPKDAPVLNRAPVSQHIEPSLPVGGKPKAPGNTLAEIDAHIKATPELDRQRDALGMPTPKRGLICDKCNEPCANPQSLSKHRNRCDGTPRKEKHKQAKAAWATTNRQKANGKASEIQCPLKAPNGDDCAMGPFKNERGLHTHQGKMHPEVTA